MKFGYEIIPRPAVLFGGGRLAAEQRERPQDGAGDVCQGWAVSASRTRKMALRPGFAPE